MTDPQEARARDRVGSLLREKWRLDRLIGVGGMAAVYAATHRNGRRGAVKILHSDVARDKEAQRRFVREGYVANAIEHPGVVAVLDDDVSEDGCAFLVMELLRGVEVGRLASERPGGRLGVGEVLFVADEVLGALAAAHARGVVHRDLKPENLFITEEKRIKVLDFGIARLREVGDGSKTSTGSMMGTPAYMPPEQALGEWQRVDARSDLWALAATMFELLTGQCVHPAENMQKLLLAAMTKPARPIRSLAPSLPEEVAAIVDRALAFQPEERYADAAAMQADVRLAKAKHGDAPAVIGVEGSDSGPETVEARTFVRGEPSNPVRVSAPLGTAPRAGVSGGVTVGFADLAAHLAPSSVSGANEGDHGRGARAQLASGSGGTLMPASADRLRPHGGARTVLVKKGAIVAGGVALVGALAGGYFLIKQPSSSGATASPTSEAQKETTTSSPARSDAVVLAPTGASSTPPASSATPAASTPEAPSARASASSAPSTGPAPLAASSTRPPATPKPPTPPVKSTNGATGTDTKYGL